MHRPLQSGAGTGRHAQRRNALQMHVDEQLETREVLPVRSASLKLLNKERCPRLKCKHELAVCNCSAGSVSST